MKTRKLLIAIILTAIMASCGSKQQSTDDIITVDVNANYPEKELILQDFMDVEYIPLETTDEFITQGVVKAIGKKHIIVINWNNDGDIFIYDRSGKGIRKINNFGQSGEEYTQTNEIVLDEDNKEIFVMDYPARKIMVYDLHGEFKRTFKFADTGYYSNTFNYDRDNLITHKGYSPEMESEESAHIIISKQDGSITQTIEIPFEEIVSPVLLIGEGTIMPALYSTTPYSDGWALTRTSTDSIYSYLSDGTISPIIKRTPSIHSMNPQVFLFPTVITDQYYFMQTLKKEFDLEKMRGFATTDLVYDKQEKALYRYSVYNDDFTNKKHVPLSKPALDSKIAGLQSLEAHDLVEAYENGELKGKLKEIVSTLDEEANPVIMLVKHKK